MTTAEKIASAKSTIYFTLFKEGIFYKCYNEDAMVFVTRVKQYKVSATYVKNVGEEVYSVGFPVGEVEKGHLTLENIIAKIGAKSFEISGKDVVFILNEKEVKSNYNTWSENFKKDMAVDMVKEPQSSYRLTANLESIFTMLKAYDLANSTPMQGLHFIQQLKNELNKREKNNGEIYISYIYRICKPEKTNATRIIN
jgi:hypothetical protein